MNIDPSSSSPQRRSCAILVDAGYLISMIAQRMTGRNSRYAVMLERAGYTIVEDLQSRAQELGMDVLRVYWFDAARTSRPDAQQRELSRCVGVKMKLGSMRVDGRQRGVDRLIQQTMIRLSEFHAVTDIVLVSGDEDMLEEFDIAGDRGIRMHLWGVCDHDGLHNQSSLLTDLADEWSTFNDDSVIERWAAVRPQVVSVEPVPVPPGSPPPPQSVVDTPEEKSPPAPPAPMQVKPVPSSPPRPSVVPSRPPVSFTPRRDLPIDREDAALAYSSDGGMTDDTLTAEDEGYAALEQLLQGPKHDDMMNALSLESGDRPTGSQFPIPQWIDGQILYIVSSAMKQLVLDEETRKEIRRGVCNCYWDQP